jgi:hypothetical protein
VNAYLNLILAAGNSGTTNPTCLSPPTPDLMSRTTRSQSIATRIQHEAACVSGFAQIVITQKISHAKTQSAAAFLKIFFATLRLCVRNLSSHSDRIVGFMTFVQSLRKLTCAIVWC